MAKAYAHSAKDRPVELWEELFVHLEETGEETASRAAKFGCAAIGRSLGRLHDFGKFKRAFQRYLHGENVTGKGHSTAGALYALRHFGFLGKALAHAIAGHHAGLQDELLAKDGRLDREVCELDLAMEGLAAAPSGFSLPQQPSPPEGLTPESGNQFGAFQWSFLIRMLFSCLVDADRICTERYYATIGDYEVERGPGATIEDLFGALSAWVEEAARARSAKGEDGKEINQRRFDILQNVRSHAGDPRGVFTLTVPTGGGKTLTGLDFALRHAAQHKLDRVIVVIPFTSVIEQTAGAYRTALGPLAGEVLEHHSAFDEEKLRGEERQGREKLQLAMENWDARIVVTTAVQFFESLFSNRPTQCRKLHNLCNSVIILDEAQTIPLKVLRPCVQALKELVRNYGCSVVLSTATQPALLARPDDPDGSFPDGFPAADVTELAPDPPRLFQLMRRVTVRLIGEQDDTSLAALLKGAPAGQALCIVNTRRHARDLHGLIAEDQPGARHLSTMMHAAHRSRVLAEIRNDLRDGRPCRVVSTSLIEAGVDVDFPLVLRAEAGLDQLAQSAGRLNREHLRRLEESLLLIFRAVGQEPPPEVKTNIETARTMLRRFGQEVLEPLAIAEYFQELYWKRGAGDLDHHGVLFAIAGKAATLDFPFATIAQDVRLIDSLMRPVIVANDGESRAWLAELRNPYSHAPLRDVARKLQRYAVGVTPKDLERLTKAYAVEAVRPDAFGDQFIALVNMDLYRPDIGLDCADPYFIDAGNLVV